jgi:2-amino-4-hydroxy-6-hydroxymethyldihydropteridine diphosphokinase
MVTGGIFIALGSNLGDRGRHLREALAELGANGEIRVLACSGFHETQPVGGPPGQPSYLNAAAELATELSPQALLARMLEIERRHGRARTVRNGPRTLDLDLLLYRGQVVEEPGLRVPHPRMWERSFVMQPLSEICPAERLAHPSRAGTVPGEGQDRYRNATE